MSLRTRNGSLSFSMRCALSRLRGKVKFTQPQVCPSKHGFDEITSAVLVTTRFSQSVSYFTVPPRAHPSTGSQSGSATLAPGGNSLSQVRSVSPSGQGIPCRILPCTEIYRMPFAVRHFLRVVHAETLTVSLRVHTTLMKPAGAREALTPRCWHDLVGHRDTVKENESAGRW